MRHPLTIAAIATALLLTIAAGIGFSDDEPGSSSKAKPMSEGEMWAKMQQLAQPGPMHKKVLARLAGTWDAKGKIFTSMGEMPITGTSVNTSVLDGRFIEVDYEGPFMGSKFQGKGYVGYDNLAKQFQQVWIMTMSTNVDVMTGTWDAKTNTLTWRGTMHAPGGVTYKKRTSNVFQNDDTFVSTSFSTGPDGKEKKEMTLTYTRVKPDAATK